MIKTREQAAAVQQRRYQSGKRGRAKAVRAYFIRKHNGSTGAAWSEYSRADDIPANFEVHTHE